MANYKLYPELQNSILGGFNVKRDSTQRAWGLVHLTGETMISEDKSFMVEGYECTAPGHLGEKKWVNISTFTGVLYIKSENTRTYYYKGKKVAKGLVEEVNKSTTVEVQEALKAFIDADAPTVKHRLQLAGLPVPEGI